MTMTMNVAMTMDDYDQEIMRSLAMTDYPRATAISMVMTKNMTMTSSTNVN